MRDYFLRRLLLIPPTVLGVTLIVFVITRFVPGGPLERAIMEAQMASAGQGAQMTGGGGSTMGEGSGLSDAQMQELKEYYGIAGELVSFLI